MEITLLRDENEILKKELHDLSCIRKTNADREDSLMNSTISPFKSMGGQERMKRELADKERLLEQKNQELLKLKRQSEDGRQVAFDL